MPVTANFSRASIVALLGTDPANFNGGVGSIACAGYLINGTLANGASVAGSSLRLFDGEYSSAGTGTISLNGIGASLPGTWRNIGGAATSDGTTYLGLSTFQRIA